MQLFDYFRYVTCLLVLVACPGNAMGASWQEEMRERDTLLACFAPANNPAQPYAGLTLPNGIDGDSAILCPKLISATYTPETSPVRYQSFLKQPYITGATTTLPKGVSGLWLGQIRIDTDDRQARVLYIYGDNVYLFRPDGGREKIFWKVYGNTLYFTTNFKYQHQIPLASAAQDKPLSCLVDEIATPTEIEIDPQEKIVWQPIVVAGKEGFLATTIASGKEKAHPKDTDAPITFKKVALTKAAKANKNSLSIAYPFTISPAAKQFLLPLHQMVRYTGQNVTQEFSTVHLKLGSTEHAFFSQALIGRKGAELFLAVDRLPVFHFPAFADPTCATKKFGEFFSAYSLLPPAEQALCLQLPLAISGQTSASKDATLPDFYTAMQNKTIAAGIISDGTKLTKKQQSYRVITQEPTAYTVQLEEQGKRKILYSFAWDGHHWRVTRIHEYAK